MILEEKTIEISLTEVREKSLIFTEVKSGLLPGMKGMSDAPVFCLRDKTVTPPALGSKVTVKVQRRETFYRVEGDKRIAINERTFRSLTPEVQATIQKGSKWWVA